MDEPKEHSEEVSEKRQDQPIAEKELSSNGISDVQFEQNHSDEQEEEDDEEEGEAEQTENKTNSESEIEESGEDEGSESQDSEGGFEDGKIKKSNRPRMMETPTSKSMRLMK
jgi:hypothetical protein